MIFLFLSILFSVVTVSFFKLFETYKVDTFQAIISNYVVCVLMGNLISDKPIIATTFWQEVWFPYTFILGFLFISIFYCIGETTRKMGVSVSMVAAKLSVVIPVILSVFLYNEHISLIKMGGITLSLFAVYFISKKENSISSTTTNLWLLPVLVFVGSGMIDSLLNFIETRYIPPANANEIVSTIFLIAFSMGILAFVYQYLFAKATLKLKSVLWGFALGVPNYFSMYFLVKTLGSYDASHIFPINNIGIVVVSTLISLLFFKEILTRINWIGFSIAIISILIISLS